MLKGGDINVIYSYQQSIIQNVSLVPLLSMPIETKPNLRVFQYWLGYSFLSFEIARHFSTPNDCLILVSVEDRDEKPRNK
ncbi:hypothetical protein [Spiroplasma endosymbiont of Polydrusus formosus]|uniref:hypothetical protein n=1 Tax=Spiroplasma endosymbiont of Polydrusus formosus TaxID=3139326 RepID=UPI0035B54D5D